MFGGAQLSSYVPDVGIQESMNEHGHVPLWKIKYVMLNSETPWQFALGSPAKGAGGTWKTIHYLLTPPPNELCH